MPQRTFVPNLLKYKRKHGFLARLHYAKHILRGWRKYNMDKKMPTIYGPFANYASRRVYEFKPPYSVDDNMKDS
ncbi:hypothetical protein FVE85_1490 [Porphyridium purpureum]|uniref:Uncharacterized protein n=1 Tax=Porphyridium purpureum TaxID=35688 RepID=A0A5J4YVN4_PORPP|nr:hypothetical protein FVE85_1490 [Porphyridium purpureum]|eukprot:POR8952..scf209_3